MTLLFYLLIAISFIFMWLNHPISIGVTIILQTIVVAMITGLLMGSFFFSYIIMMIMLSGILVLFIYMASVASNEKFNYSIKLSMTTMMIILTGIYFYITEDFSENEMTNLNDLSTEEISLNMLFSEKMKFLTMFLVLYLFLTMVTVSLIVNISEGPLRINKK